ncbi:MAG: sulfite exporter TauE/SafE family protein [Ilumatobacteraceae bacterium]
MDLLHIGWVVLVVAVSSLAQSLAGFGFGLLAVPLMTLVIEPHQAVIVATMIGTVSTTLQAIIDRRFADLAMAKRLSIAAYLGMPFGFVVFLVISESVMRFALGVVVLIATFVLARGFSFRGQSKSMDWLMGWLSGVLSTSTSTNGPPLVFLLQARGIEPHVFRATINAVFAISNIGALILFGSSGSVEMNGLLAAIVSLPFLFTSLKVGYLLRPKVKVEHFRKLVLGMLLLSGVSVLSSSFL